MLPRRARAATQNYFCSCPLSIFHHNSITTVFGLLDILFYIKNELIKINLFLSLQFDQPVDQHIKDDLMFDKVKTSIEVSRGFLLHYLHYFLWIVLLECIGKIVSTCNDNKRQELMSFSLSPYYRP